MTSIATISAAIFLLVTSRAAMAAPACDAPDEKSREEQSCLDDGKGHACLVTGNGHGYAVVDSQTGGLRKFFAHPYASMRSGPTADDEGVKTPNFLESATWKAQGGGESKPPSFVSQSQVVSSVASGVKQSFFMPFGLERNAVITTGQSGACLDLKLNSSKRVKKDSVETIGGRHARVIEFEGVAERLLLVPLDEAVQPVANQGCLAGSEGWAMMSVDAGENPSDAVRDLDQWQNRERPERLANREVTDSSRWHLPPGSCAKSDDEAKLYRQSESVLRMAQVREPNRQSADPNQRRTGSGMINASLPDGEFFNPFVRDQVYSTTALVASGHVDEAKKALTAMLNNGVSPALYHGSGQQYADTHSESGRKNREYDDWGFALWGLGEFYGKTRDRAWLDSPTNRGTVYENIRDHVVKQLFDRLEPAPGGGLIVKKDTSVWEQNDQPYSHYAASTIAAIGGLKRFLEIAKDKNDVAKVREVEAKLQELQKGFEKTFIVNGELRGRPPGEDPTSRNSMDGALLEAINMGVIKDPELIRKTLARMQQLKMDSGGYRRTKNALNSCRFDQYEKHEFLLIDFNLARAYLRMGELEKADQIVKTIVERSKNDNNMIPEMYVSKPNPLYSGAIGAPAGATPMAGYGAGAYMLYLAERRAAESAAEANLPLPREIGAMAQNAALKPGCGDREPNPHRDETGRNLQ